MIQRAGEVVRGVGEWEGDDDSFRGGVDKPGNIGWNEFITKREG